jgi:hypothetical protein
MFVDPCVIVQFIQKNPTRWKNVSKFITPHLYEIINFATLFHLVGLFCMNAFKRSEVIMSLSVKIKFWHEAPCSLIDTPKLFGGMCSPHVSTLTS